MRLHIIVTYNDAEQEIFELFYKPITDDLREEDFLKYMFSIIKHPEKLDTLSVARFYNNGTAGMLPTGPFNEGKWWFNIENNKGNKMVLGYKNILNKWLQETKDYNKQL